MDADFREHILSSYDLTPRDFDRLMEEINGYYGNTLEEFIRHRHFVLKRDGLKNETIYSRIHQDIKDFRFAAGEISERQIRRIIYG